VVGVGGGVVRRKVGSACAFYGVCGRLAAHACSFAPSRCLCALTCAAAVLLHMRACACRACCTGGIYDRPSTLTPRSACPWRSAFLTRKRCCICDCLVMLPAAVSATTATLVFTRCVWCG
jgi:hypothetical protein